MSPSMSARVTAAYSTLIPCLAEDIDGIGELLRLGVSDLKKSREMWKMLSREKDSCLPVMASEVMPGDPCDHAGAIYG